MSTTSLTRLFTGNKWGTANPVMMRDQDFGVVRLRAFGIYDFKIVDPKLFLKEVAGTDDHFRLDEFNDTMRSRIVSVFSEALAQAKVPALDVAARYAELGEALLPLINPQTTSKYGLAGDQFCGRERVGAAGSRAGDRQALEHGCGRQSERLREVPDGTGPGEGRRRWRWRHGRADGGGHGDGAADAEPDRRHPRQPGDARHPGTGRGRCAGRSGAAGRTCSRRRRLRRCSAWEKRTSWPASNPAISRARRSARNGASPRQRSISSCIREPDMIRSCCVAGAARCLPQCVWHGSPPALPSRRDPRALPRRRRRAIGWCWLTAATRKRAGGRHRAEIPGGAATLRLGRRAKQKARPDGRNQDPHRAQDDLPEDLSWCAPGRLRAGLLQHEFCQQARTATSRLLWSTSDDGKWRVVGYFVR